MIKLIKITKQYAISAYTTHRHILIIGISLLQEVTFDYSTLKAHISKTTNDRNKQISDSETIHLEVVKEGL